MTCGLVQGGIDVIAGIDNDPACRETYEKNNPNSKFVLADVFELKERQLVKELSLKKKDDDLVLIGCSPCQFWSIIQTDRTKSQKSKNLLSEFKRFVDYLLPGYVLVENVPGILSKKDKSGLDSFVSDLEKKGYTVHYEIVNMSDYGVPQSRRRFSLLASRLHKKPIFPIKNDGQRPTVRDAIGKGFSKISAGHRDNTTFHHSTANLSERNLARLKKTKKNGGSRLDWADDKKLMRTKYRGTEFVDNYGRLTWDKPSPTITTKFISISNGRFAHPEQHRGLSIREGATLQSFPADYVFPGPSLGVSAKIIGNAVPPRFAKRLAETIVEAHSELK